MSRRWSNVALPSQPIRRSPIVQFDEMVFVGCVAPSSEQGDIVAFNVAGMHR